ncbi:winged helix-turn-helix transcriptional regulator [Amycolatopsis rubida]|uniref:HxlR-like helix-turn-helix n=1 Tax=Amycolatopsis rubida TaxID=112413 RepID=A0A1I5QSZ3_9PSEU|nr:HxlR-like helix-turn-helix [Amycolatopsis rubida]
MTGRQPLPPDLFEEPFRFGDKWSALVIRCLEDGPRRFPELRVPLHRVTPVLARTLRGLERSGLVSRTAHADPASGVEYALTALGRSLLEPMKAV